MLDVVDGILSKVRAHSLDVPLDMGADSTDLATSMLLVTGHGTHPIRVDALQSCSMPPNMGSRAMHCKFTGSTTGCICHGNVLAHAVGGAWVLEMVHHKRGKAGHVPITVEWAADNREGHLSTAWRHMLHSGEAPLPLTGVEVAPLLLHPQSLMHIPPGNWTSAWSSPMAHVLLLDESDPSGLIGSCGLTQFGLL
jgi:hypothetical protein